MQSVGGPDSRLSPTHCSTGAGSSCPAPPGRAPSPCPALSTRLQASYEEELLEERFGPEYADYKRSTKKFVPYIY